MRAWLLRHRWTILLAVGLTLIALAVVSEKQRRDALRRSAVGGPVRGTVGPRSADVEEYVAGQRRYLARQAQESPTTPAAGLVSFARYLDAAETSLAISVGTSQVVFVRPGDGQPRVLRVRGSVEATLREEGLDAGCRCVYAALVGGTTLGDLLRLSQSPDVRLVDVAKPPRADLRGWELRPILPRPTS